MLFLFVYISLKKIDNLSTVFAVELFAVVVFVFVTENAVNDGSISLIFISSSLLLLPDALLRYNRLFLSQHHIHNIQKLDNIYHQDSMVS